MSDGRSTPQDLLDFLRARLPEYLVPATMTVLDRLPLRASGKLDRGALPSPRPVSPTPGGAGSVAEMVAWYRASTLPTGQPEADDDFFAVGGNSLLAVRLVAQVRQKLGIDDEHNYLLVTNLLNEPTLRAFISTVEWDVVRGRDDAHAYGRLAEAQRRYGIHRPLPEHRVCPVLGDLTKPGLGMREADWEREAARADVNHHCGAEVTFLYPYEKLRAADVSGTQEVLHLAVRRAIPVHDVTTMSVVHGMGVAGVRLCVWVASADRDEEVFTEPDTFRIDRDSNPHLAFVAGRHFCLGASLSRLELRLVFESLLTRVESIHLSASRSVNDQPDPRIRKRPRSHYRAG